MEKIPSESEKEDRMEFPDIASEIEEMAKADQEMRNRIGRQLELLDKQVDMRNTARMKEIVAQIGWPTVSKVGKWPSYNAWLLVQHADRDLGFQQHCLELMRSEPADEVEPSNIAYLEDRVRVAMGQPQRYGTQFEAKDGKYVPCAIDDPERVDERRLSVGLDSLEEYAKQMNDA